MQVAQWNPTRSDHNGIAPSQITYQITHTSTTVTYQLCQIPTITHACQLAKSLRSLAQRPDTMSCGLVESLEDRRRQQREEDNRERTRSRERKTEEEESRLQTTDHGGSDAPASRAATPAARDTSSLLPPRCSTATPAASTAISPTSSASTPAA